MHYTATPWYLDRVAPCQRGTETPLFRYVVALFQRCTRHTRHVITPLRRHICYQVDIACVSGRKVNPSVLKRYSQV